MHCRQIYCIFKKFNVQGSSGAYIYVVFKFTYFGTQTAPEALPGVFGDSIQLQRAIPMSIHECRY